MFFKSFQLVLMISSPLLLFTACFNRPPVQDRSLPASAYGMEVGRPSIVTFSALWCHPCREEIESLNQASQEFGDQIQIKGYLVEGEEKGSPVQESDLASFKSFDGVSPGYPVALDQSWALFDKTRAPEGRALPTMVIIDRNGQTQEIVQQSLDYASQLRPILQALIAGQTAPDIPSTDSTAPPPAQPGQQQLTDTVENWLARAEIAANPNFETNLTAAWKAGLIKLDFTADEMPLNSGQMTFAFDGKTNTPEGVTWHANTAVSICQLHLNLNADATLNGSPTGSCHPK